MITVNRSTTTRRFLSLLLVCALMLSCAPAVRAEDTEAAAMWLRKTEGTVTVTNAKGKDLPVREKLRLYSGYGVSTEEASYAWINLDDEKLLKADAVSELSVRKSGKMLEVLLESGNMFFDVTKTLEDDESLNIRTSTMSAGIRGTSGWVRTVDEKTSRLYVLEGTVEVCVTDPITGEDKTEPVTSGEAVDCVVYPDGETGERCDILRARYSVEDIDGFVLTDVKPDEALCAKIKDASGLDILGWGGDPAGKLRQDQEEVAEKLRDIEDLARKQENRVSTEKVWTSPQPGGSAPSESLSDRDDDRDSGSGSSGSSGGSSGGNTIVITDSVSRTVTFDPNGGGWNGSTESRKVSGIRSGSALGDSMPENPTRTGYTFAGWQDESGNAFTASTPVTQSLTLTAQWTEDGPLTTYTITLDSRGGTVESSLGSMVTGPDKKLSSLPAVSRTVRHPGETPETSQVNATGWFMEDGTEVTTDTVFSGNCTIYARWEVNWDYDTAAGKLTIFGDGNMANYSDSTQVPWNSFKSDITEVDIEEGVTSISALVFLYCTSLTKVTIPESVEFIGGNPLYGGAFEGCTSLASVTIPESVTSISARTFQDCTSLTSMTIPKGVTLIGNNVFSGCTSLRSVTIPSSVQNIYSGAFSGCTSLESVTIPEGVKTIGQSAFQGCSMLKDVTIQEGVETIATFAFNSCTALTSVTIPSSVTIIDHGAFEECTSLESVTIPSSVTSISQATFAGCSALTSVTIPSSISSIGPTVFSDCTSLESITIPSSVITIGWEAFQGCSSLTDIFYTGTEEQWNAITMGFNAIPTGITVHYSDGGTSITGLALDGASARLVQYSDLPYTDVPAGAWYEEAVRFCRDRGVMLGTSETAFSPESPLTRGMLVTVLHRLAGCPAPGAAASFLDVSAGKYYAEAVAWAGERGVVQGYASGLFGPDDLVTHRQMALIFQRYAGAAVETPGKDTPSAPATRAEAAVALMNCATTSRASAMDVLCAPSGIALDKDGSLLVTDVYHKRLWRVENRASAVYAGGQTVLDLYGEPLGGYNDAGLEDSYFREPWAVAPFLDGWAVSDRGNNAVRLIRNGVTQTVNGATRERLKVTDLGVVFEGPTGLAADGDGNLYVSDTGNGAVRRISPQGGVETVAKNLSEPTGLFWKNGILYIAETGANRIVKLENGKVTTVAGSREEGLKDGKATQAAFSSPRGVTAGDDGSVYVADTVNGAVRRIKDGQVTTIAARDPSQLSAGLTSPTGLLIQGDQLYVCDAFAKKVFVFSIE